MSTKILPDMSYDDMYAEISEVILHPTLHDSDRVLLLRDIRHEMIKRVAQAQGILYLTNAYLEELG